MKYNEYNLQLKNKNKIVFGPFLGEIGWELTRWCGWVRWYKKHHPNKKIVAATRESRSDLYYGSVDQIYTFKINEDYITYRPNMYSIDYMPLKRYDRMIRSAKNMFRDFYFIGPPKNTVGRNFFPKDRMDFDFSPHPENLRVIEEILSKHKNRIPICISPRHRKDSSKLTRNWPENNWIDLFNMLNRTKKFFIFLIGGKSSMMIPKLNKNMVVLDDIRLKNTSNIGLTIEALRKSSLTIGQQSALPILSNYLGTPTVMWGHEKVRHQVNENPMNTKCKFFEESTVQYNTNPTLIFESIKRETIC